MPVAVTYPGVYVEEIPSGVRTITGVATSITAFVGWAPQGPIDRAQLILSWSDYERKFGGLNKDSDMSYAVSQFFKNGGNKAYIIRLVSGAGTGIQTLDGKLDVSANNPGEWAKDYAVITKTRNDAEGTDANGKKKFRLQVVRLNKESMGAPVEVFENLSMDPKDARFVKTVIENESRLITAAPKGGATDPPADTPGDRKDPADPTKKLPFDLSEEPVPDSAKLSGGTSGTVLKPSDDAFKTAVYSDSGAGGVKFLDRIDLFNILCVPGMSDPATVSELEKFCRDHRAFLIVDCAEGNDFSNLQNGPSSVMTGADSINAAFYFPWVKAPDPLQENRPREFPPCGFVAGLYARTDTSRGVWKAPAGTEASLTGVLGVKEVLTDNENGVLNPKAVNCIRNFPVYGTIVWGARTLQGNDERGSEWKYVPVRRTALYIEESLYRALKWVVFEPNDEPLWSQVRLNVGAFMHNLFRQGAFQGASPKDAYFVKCDKETTTQNDINLGIVNIHVGFAPLKPAEFVIIKLQQIAGQIEV